MSSTADLLNRLRHFVQAEAEGQYSALDRQWSRPLSERVAKGWALEGLRMVGLEKGIIRLHCDTNDSRFREGDLLVLHRDNPKDPNALHVELQYDGETELEFSIIKGNHYFLTVNPEGWITDQDWFDSSPFHLDALDTVADSLRGRTTILPLLQGSLTPKIDYARYERAAQEVVAAGLNDSQIEAVAQAYAADLLHLIQGPPGTGKTLMLAYLAKLLVVDGQRALVTALTHRAIHNALNKILKLVLHASGQGCQALIQAINHRLGKNAAMDPKDTYPGDYVRVTTLNAGAELESPIVFLVGLRELFEEEQSIRLSDDERESIIRDNTRKIYMAATRAGQRLVFTYVGDLPDILKQIFLS